MSIKTKRWLGLDVGSKSCGIASTDLLKITAQGRENFMFEEYNFAELINHLTKNYFKDIERIIVGLPLLPSGDDSTTTKMIRAFVDKLKLATTIPIIFEEEFGTTKMAKAVMIEAGLSRRKQKQHKDKLAAVLILQSYMERNNHG